MSHKIFDILSTFSEQEWKLFGKFIKSPYFTGNKDYLYIFKIYKNYFKNREDSPNLDNDSIFQKILKRKRIEKHTFQNKVAELYKLAEKFIAIRRLEKNEDQKLLFKLSEYSERNLQNCFNNTLKYSKNYLSKNIYDQKRFLTLSKVSRYNALFKQSTDNFKDTTEGYYSSSEYEMVVFLENLFRYALDFYLIKDFGFSIDFNLPQEIFNSLKIETLIERIEKEDKWYFSSLLMRYHIYNAFSKNEKEESIKKAMNLFIKSKDNFSFEIYKEFYFIFEKYYIDTNDKQFNAVLISLFKERINKELLSETNKDNYGDEIRFAINKGLKYNEIEWVKKLIEDFIPRLPNDKREELRIISLARLYIHENKYEKAYSILENKKFKRQHNILDGYYLRTYITFELEKYEETFLEIDKLRHYIKKTTINKTSRENYKLYILNLTRLLKITTSVSNAGLEDLNLHIGKIRNPLFDREWFFSKIDILRKRNRKAISNRITR